MSFRIGSMLNNRLSALSSEKTALEEKIVESRRSLHSNEGRLLVIKSEIQELEQFQKRLPNQSPTISADGSVIFSGDYWQCFMRSEE